MIRNLQLLSTASCPGAPGGRWPAGISQLAALVTLGVISASCALPLTDLTTSTRKLSLRYLLSDTLLIFLLALIAVTVGLSASRRLGIVGKSVPELLTRAALVAGLFALVLFCVSGPRQILQRAFGASPTHVFHGQPRAAQNKTDARISSGLREASLGYLAALPLMFFGLVLIFRRGSDVPPGANMVPDRRRAHRSSRVLVSTSIALAAVTAGAAGSILSLTKGTQVDGQGTLEHTHPVTRMAVNGGFGVEDLRVTVESAQWLRQARLAETIAATDTPTAAANDVDRIYLEVTFENTGDRLRSIGRGAFRLVAPDETGWAPLADDFPEIVLGPSERLTTRLIFEVPPQATQFAFTSVAGPAEKRVPIGADPIGGLLGTLCRALVKTWGS